MKLNGCLITYIEKTIFDSGENEEDDTTKFKITTQEKIQLQCP